MIATIQFFSLADRQPVFVIDKAQLRVSLALQQVRGNRAKVILESLMAGPTGLEPATSGLTGQRSKPG
jgi:hypothetical protein